MIDKKILSILQEDWENKKSFDANWKATCSLCHDAIEEGDPFFFYGEKKKCCDQCFSEIVDTLEEEKEGIAKAPRTISSQKPLPKCPLPKESKRPVREAPEIDPDAYMADDLPF